MGGRFTLDPASFETLLEAAWVLQSERERRLKTLLDAIEEGRRTSATPAPQTITATDPVDSGKVADPSDPPASKPPRIPSASVVGPTYSGSAVQGTLALARQSRSVLARVSKLTLVPGTGRKLSKAAGLNLAWISALDRGAVLSAIAPAAILLVILTFLISQMFKPATAPPASDLVLGGPFLANASIHHDAPANQEHRLSAPQLQTSHLRITDPATATVIQGLSRFEIRGLERQAKYGDDSAALTLGMAYEVGRHLPQNCTKAADFVRMAAESGNPAAQYNLALRYHDGDGVAANPEESTRWLSRAVGQGYRQDEFSLAEQ